MIGPWPLTDIASTDKGADLSRLLLDWVAANASPNTEVLSSVRRLRARAREQERNNAHVASYLSLLTNNVIGPTGFDHEATVMNSDGTTPAEKLNRSIEDAWERWCEAPTVDGRLSMVELLELTIKTIARDGETFDREWTGPDFPCGYALEPIDADLIDESSNRPGGDGVREIRAGVHVDRFGRPVGYQVVQGSALWDYSLVDARRMNDIVLPASHVIHLARFRRLGQSRGVTWLGPALITLKMIEGYEEAELVAARTAAAKMGFFTAKTNDAGAFGANDPNAPFVMEANPGTMEQLPKGWEFQSWDPHHPTDAFPVFIKANIRKVASSLGCGYNDLAGDLEGVNYSSLRSGQHNARATWRRHQLWLVSKFLMRVYRRWIVTAAASGEISTGGRPIEKLFACKFTPHGFDSPDPLKDIQADILAIRNGLDSPQRILAEKGIDPEDTLRQIAEFNDLAKELGVDITGEDTAKSIAGEAGDSNADTGTQGAEPGARNGLRRGSVLGRLQGGLTNGKS